MVEHRLGAGLHCGGGVRPRDEQRICMGGCRLFEHLTHSLRQGAECRLGCILPAVLDAVGEGWIAAGARRFG